MNETKSVQIGALEQKQVNWKQIQQDLASLVGHLHEELGWFDAESLANTPDRVLRFYKEFYGSGEAELNFTKFDRPKSQASTLISLRKIRTYSLCQHHMLPFEMDISIGYLPAENGKICGLSKLSRTAMKFASKPAIQEQVTQEIVDFLMNELRPIFVVCVIEGKHHCSMIRGVRQQASLLTTSAMGWDTSRFGKSDAEHAREDFVKVIKWDIKKLRKTQSNDLEEY
ncbi:MAG: GTP cyclohydrolase I [Candidatus Micrarchaeota archaeon]|nr:GTP cyclohydrolase I [Candidatus Micrarchaeota archaeon]